MTATTTFTYSHTVGFLANQGRGFNNPVDMAHHYLKLLDKREFKRSHFRLISS